MSRLLDALRGWLLAAALLTAALLAWAADHYRAQARAAQQALATLQGSVALQNQVAQQRLADLQSRRDAAQAALDSAYQQQEQADAATHDQITRLRGELQRRPVRVRFQSLPATVCGLGGGSTAGDAAAGSDAGAADPAPSHGLLPAGNSARLGAVILEVETLNAAYASCRASLAYEEQP